MNWNTNLLQYNHPLHEYVALINPEPAAVEQTIAGFWIAKPSEQLDCHVQRTDLGTRIEYEVWKQHDVVGIYTSQEEADAACALAQPTCDWCTDFASRTAAL